MSQDIAFQLLPGRKQPLFGSLGPSQSYLAEGSKYPIIRYLGLRLIVIVVRVLGKYMIVRLLDPQRSRNIPRVYEVKRTVSCEILRVSRSSYVNRSTH